MPSNHITENGRLPITPWFADTLRQLILGIYVAGRPMRNYNRERWIGQLLTFSAILMAVGVKPDSVFAPDDLQTLYMEMR